MNSAYIRIGGIQLTVETQACGVWRVAQDGGSDVDESTCLDLDDSSKQPLSAFQSFSGDDWVNWAYKSSIAL